MGDLMEISALYSLFIQINNTVSKHENMTENLMDMSANMSSGGEVVVPAAVLRGESRGNDGSHLDRSSFSPNTGGGPFKSLYNKYSMYPLCA